MSGKGTTKVPFNSVQIKDGWIVRVDKSGRITSKIEKYFANHSKSAK